LLNFGIRHRTASIEAKRGIAVMAKNTIARRIMEFAKFSVKRISSRSFFFSISSDMVKAKKFYWFRSTGISAVIARASKSSISHNYSKSNLLVAFISHFQFIFFPFRIFIPFTGVISCSDSSRFPYFIGGHFLSGMREMPGRRTRVATKFTSLFCVFIRFLALRADMLMHEYQSNPCLVVCQ